MKLSDLEKEKLSELLKKYNDVLFESMKIAVAEDFQNLIILNRDDTSFDLKHLMLKKSAFKNYVFKEFLKFNTNQVIEEMKLLPEQKLQLKNKKPKSKKLNK